MSRLTDCVPSSHCGSSAHRIHIDIWEDDDYVLVVDGRVCGQTLSLERAKMVGQWLSTALGSIKPTATPVREIED